MRLVSITVIAALLMTVTGCGPSDTNKGTASPNLIERPSSIDTQIHSPPNGQGSYEDLVALFTQFHDWKTLTAEDGNIDYSPEAIIKRRAELRGFQAKLPNFAVATWNHHQRVDYLAVRAQMDLQDFTLNVTKPWARDPGMYIDKVRQLAYTDLPLNPEELSEFQASLRGIPEYLSQAWINLDAVAKEYTVLAIFGLSNGDGVGHGMPYRSVEPEGLIGWFADLKDRANETQPDLVVDIEAAESAILEFQGWLIGEGPKFTASAGVGRPAYDWFLKNVRLMPYDSDEIVTLGQRELERHWANYATERHRNRNLPELKLPTSAAEYETQVAGTDAMIRKWLKKEEIITIPDYIPSTYQEVGFNVPWIVRPNGPTFWEQIQYRDASPDHLHATFPGHRFDGITAKRVTSPIRSKIRDSGRTEGWAFYLEETALQLGLFDDRPRTRELIYVFGLFRAVRTIGDVKMQRNEMNVEDAMHFWKDWTPYLDDNVAREDARIYLRRPPGYGMSYTMGAMQLQKLLVDRKRQLGDAFSIKDFHDYLMNTGRLPVSLLRYDLTELDDEVREFWHHEPLDTRQFLTQPETDK